MREEAADVVWFKDVSVLKMKLKNSQDLKKLVFIWKKLLKWNVMETETGWNCHFVLKLSAFDLRRLESSVSVSILFHTRILSLILNDMEYGTYSKP